MRSGIANRIARATFVPVRAFSEKRPYVRFSEEEMMMRETVAKFANEVIKPKVAQMDHAGKLDPEILKQLFAQGLMGIETDAELGGAGMTFTAAMVAVEELAKIDPAVALMVDVQNTLVSIPFRKFGTEEQKKKWLPPLATDKVGAFALTEEAAGCDAFALKMRAEKKGNKWVLNGNKLWISCAHEAEIFVVFANVDPSKGYKGITAFIVPRENGVQVGKKEDKLGIRASSTCPLTLENVEVPLENVLGPVGQGYKVAMETLNWGRVGIAAQMVGCAQGALDATLPYLWQRKQFGQFIGDFQGMQFQYAQAATEVEAARLLLYHAARLAESGAPCQTEAAMAKLFTCQVAERSASKCIELMGGTGYTKECPVEKFYRDCKIGPIYEGTSNMQLLTIAKALKVTP